MIRPRLIATDLDGTLLGSDSRVSRLNRAAIERATSQGIPVVIATGRPVRWLDVLDGLTAAHPLVIVSNGGGVYDLSAHELVSVNPVAPEIALEVVRRARAVFPEAGFAFEYADGYGREHVVPVRPDLADQTIAGQVDDLAHRAPILKLLAYHSGIMAAGFAAGVRGVAADLCTITHSASDDEYALLEISGPDVSKASALSRLCAELHVAAADVVAFGDMPNDLEMLTWAGRGYRMREAHQVLLDAGFPDAGPHDDSGVGRTILRLLGESDE